MGKYDAVRELLRRQFMNQNDVMVAEVIEVDEGSRTCTVSDEDIDIPGVRLQVVDSAVGLLAVPAVGSYVAVLKLDMPGELLVIATSVIDSLAVSIGSSLIEVKDGEIKINGGTLGGIVKIADVVSQLNALEQDLNTLKTVFASWVPVAQDGGASLKIASEQWAAATLQPTTVQQLEDTTFKH